LFARHGRGVRTTAEGQRLLTRLSQHFDEIAALIDRSQRPRARETVRLAVTSSFARFWLLPRLKTLEADELKIEVMASDRHADLAAGEADIAIRYGRGGWGMATETVLLKEELVPVAVLPNDTALEQFAQDPFALPVIHSADTFLWRGWAKRHGRTLRNRGHDRVVADYALSIDAARAGLGVALWNKGLHPIPDGLQTVSGLVLKEPPLNYHLISAKEGSSAAASRLAERLLARGPFDDQT
jgi:DNA-binding transcriptional LysR family regulator